MREALRERARWALARESTDLGWREGLIVRDRAEACQNRGSLTTWAAVRRAGLFAATCARRE